MRKLVFIAVLCGAFVAAPVKAGPFGHGEGYDGGTADWDRKDGYFAGRGGEFTIWGSGLLLSNSAYADTTSGLAVGGTIKSESFQSFCIETGENIFESMEIWVSEASTTQLAVYGSGSHAYKGGTFGFPAPGDDLDYETAYLYTQFATGSLNYAYTGTIDVGGVNLDRSQTAGALQRLIWHIEGEGGSITTVGDEHYGITLTAAQVSLISSWHTAYTGSGWTGIGDVRVLQTYEKEGAECDFWVKQDQLYLTPVPGAVLLGMIGLGVAGVKLRKFA